MPRVLTPDEVFSDDWGTPAETAPQAQVLTPEELFPEPAPEIQLDPSALASPTQGNPYQFTPDVQTTNLTRQPGSVQGDIEQEEPTFTASQDYLDAAMTFHPQSAKEEEVKPFKLPEDGRWYLDDAGNIQDKWLEKAMQDPGKYGQQLGMLVQTGDEEKARLERDMATHYWKQSKKRPKPTVPAFLVDTEDPMAVMEYNKGLPYQINADIAGDQELADRYEMLNEIATGELGLTKTIELRDALNAYENAQDPVAKKQLKEVYEQQRQDTEYHMGLMEDLAKKAKAAEMLPNEYVAKLQAGQEGTTALPLQLAKEFGKGLLDMPIAGKEFALGQYDQRRQRLGKQQIREQVEGFKDAERPLGEFWSGAARGASRSMGMMAGPMVLGGAIAGGAPAAGANAGNAAFRSSLAAAESAGGVTGKAMQAATAAGNTARTAAMGARQTLGERAVYAPMGAFSGVEGYMDMRDQGRGVLESGAYAAIKAGIEIGSEMAGGAITKPFGMATAQEAFIRKGLAQRLTGTPMEKVLTGLGRVSGGGAVEGLEEGLATLGNATTDYLWGLDDRAFQDAQYAKDMATGMLAGSAMNASAEARAAVDFVLNPTKETADLAGIPDDMADIREAMAADVVDAMAESVAATAAGPAQQEMNFEDPQTQEEYDAQYRQQQEMDPGGEIQMAQMEAAHQQAMKIAESFGVTPQRFQEIANAMPLETPEDYGNLTRTIIQEARDSRRRMGQKQSQDADKEAIVAEQQPEPEYSVQARDKVKFRDEDGQIREGIVQRVNDDGKTVSVRIPGPNKKQNKLQKVKLRDLILDAPAQVDEQQATPEPEPPIRSPLELPQPKDTPPEPPSQPPEPEQPPQEPPVGDEEIDQEELQRAAKEAIDRLMGGQEEDAVAEPPAVNPNTHAQSGARVRVMDAQTGKVGGYPTPFIVGEGARVQMLADFKVLPRDQRKNEMVPVISRTVTEDGGATRNMEPYEHLLSPVDENGNVVEDGKKLRDRLPTRERVQEVYDQQIAALENEKSATTKSQQLDQLKKVKEWLDKTAPKPRMGAKPKESTPEPEQPPKARLGEGKPADTKRNYGTLDAPSRVELGKRFEEMLNEGKKFDSINSARKVAGDLLGGKILPGTEAAKEVDEAVEQGVVRAARKIVRDGIKNGNTEKEIFDNLVGLYNRQPNLDVRTSNSMLDQAYSTPAPLSFVSQMLAGITPETKAYDSSAGNGMLLIVSDAPLANELDTGRVESLIAQGITTTKGDATEQAPPKGIDAVIINPPFSKVKPAEGGTKTWTIGGVTTDQIDHAIVLKTLEGLPEGGKATLIIGARGFSGGKPKADMQRAEAYLRKQKPFYETLYDRYNVTDHFTVDGSLYSRQGAGFPVDIIVIDGKGKSSRPRPWNFQGNGLPQVFNTWEEIRDAKLQEIPVGSPREPARGPDRGGRDGTDGGTVSGSLPPRPGADGTTGAGPVRGERERVGGSESPDRIQDGGGRPGAESGRSGGVPEGVREVPPLSEEGVPGEDRNDVGREQGVGRDNGVAGESDLAPDPEELAEAARGVFDDMFGPAEEAATPGEEPKPQKQRLGRAKSGQFVFPFPGMVQDANRQEWVSKHRREILDAIEEDLGADATKKLIPNVSKTLYEIHDNATKYAQDPDDGFFGVDDKAKQWMLDNFWVPIDEIAEEEGIDVLSTGSSYLQERLQDQLNAALEERQKPEKPTKDDTPPPADPPEQKKTPAEEARERAKKALEELAKALADPTTLTVGLNMQHLELMAKAAKALVEAGVLTFAEFTKNVYNMFPEKIHEFAPYMEAVWTEFSKRNKNLGPVGKVTDYYPKLTENEKRDQDNPQQVSYKPKSGMKSLETLLPVNHAPAIMKALDEIEEKHGNIDEYVAKELGFDMDRMGRVFGAEQVDALALAISNDQKGEAFILADQTGVGKGRVVAGMMVYAMRKGMIPLFVTEKASLFADIIRDLTAIEVNANDSFVPLITNALATQKDAVDLNGATAGASPRVVQQSAQVAKQTMLEALAGLKSTGKLQATTGQGKGNQKKAVTFDAIFTTYSQFQPLGSETPWRQSQFFAPIIDKTYLIMDESHNALGTANQTQARSTSLGDPRAIFLRRMVDNAANVMYSSATFAKRHDVMDLYRRAGIHAALSNNNDLIETINVGGIPMQQAVSEMLVEAGLMIRRERSYDGVEFATKSVEISKQVPDDISRSFREINDFSLALAPALTAIKGDAVSAGGTVTVNRSADDTAVTATNFASRLHNIVNQSLLSLKADAAADEAIAAIKRGESPVIAVDNTMESAIERHLAENRISKGGKVKFGVKDLMEYYLVASRTLTVKPTQNPADNYTYFIPDEVLLKHAPEALTQYTKAMQEIESFKHKMPGSPIDWIRYRLQQAGYNVAEITGRKLAFDYTGGDMSQATLSVRPEEEIGNEGKQATVAKFNSGELDALVINRSGSTGLSLHAGREFKNWKRRHMIIAQAALNIDEFMQMLGRINRTGQVVEDGMPRYTLFMTNAPAEKRPASMLAKKLKSLNANVTASSDGSVGFDVPDIINKVGDDIVATWIMDNMDQNFAMGNPAQVGNTGAIGSRNGLARRVTGRIVLLSIAEQEAFWEEIGDNFKQTIAELDAINRNPLSAPTLDLDAKVLESLEIFKEEGGGKNPFLMAARLVKADIKALGQPMSYQEVTNALAAFLGLPKGADSAAINAASREWSKKAVTEDLVKPGKAWEQARIDGFREAHQNRIEGVTDEVKLMEEEIALANRINNFSQQMDEQRGRIADKLDEFRPGSVVMYRGDEHSEPMQGVVVGVHLPRKNNNPNAPSQWMLDIAVADSTRKVSVALSGIKDDKLARMFHVREETLNRRFQEAGSVFREKRWMVTGNMLAGMEKVRKSHGTIVFYKDTSGETQRAILMPRNFDAGAWLAERPAVFEGPKDVLKFLKNGGRAQSTDEVLLLIYTGGHLTVQAPKARSKGGKYTANRAMLERISPYQFVSVGQRMDLAIPEANQAKQLIALANIMEISGIQANADREIARQMERDGKIKLASGGDITPTDETGGPRDVLASEAPGGKKRLSAKAAKPSGGRTVGNNVRQTLSTDARSGTQTISAQDIIRTWSRLFDVPIYSGRVKTAGVFQIFPDVIRQQEPFIASLAVAAHEIAHHIDKMHTMTGVAGGPAVIPTQYQAEIRPLDYEPQKARFHEGFAEYIRMWITEQNAPAMAPAFTVWFEDVFLPANPGLQKKLIEARQAARQFGDQGVFERIQSLIGPKGSVDLNHYERWKAAMNTNASRRMRVHVDALHPLRPIGEEAEKEGYTGLKPYDVAMAYSMTAVAEAEAALTDGPRYLKNQQPVGAPSIWDAKQYTNTNEEVTEAIAYSYARHTLYMANKKPGFHTGMDLATAQLWVEQMKDEGKADRYDNFARVISQYHFALLEMEVDAGSASRTHVDRIKSYYRDDNYFPLLRASDKQKANPMLSGSGYVNLPPTLRGRSAKGSGRKIIDPFDAAVYKTIHSYNRAIKAQVFSSLVNIVDPRANPWGAIPNMGDYMVRVDPKRKKHEGIVQEILKSLVEEGMVSPEDAEAWRVAALLLKGKRVSKKRLEQFMERHGIDPEDPDAYDQAVVKAMSEPNILAEIALWRNDYSPDGKNHIVVHHDRNGDPVLYQVDPMLYEVVTAVGEESMQDWVRILRETQIWFKAGAAGASTLFAGINMPADYVTYQGRAVYVKGWRTLTSPFAMMGAYLASKAFGWDNAVVNLMESTGGKMTTRLGDDMARKRLRRNKMRHGRAPIIHTLANPWEALSAAKDAANNALDVLQELVAWSDLPPRLAEMRAAIAEDGYSYKGSQWYDSQTGKQVASLPQSTVIKAILAASEATINFKRGGTSAPTREAFAPFSRATINSIYRHVGLMVNLKEIGSQGTKGDQARRYAVYLASLAALQFLYWRHRRDDDDYREQEEHVRRRYWTFAAGDFELRIPKPRDEAVFLNAIEAYLDSTYYPEDEGIGVGRMVAMDMADKLPVGGGALRGGLEVLANYDWFRDRQIVPEYLQSKPEQLQIGPYTSLTSTYLSNLVGKYVGISPLEMDHLFNAATGGAYGRLTNLGEEGAIWATGGKSRLGSGNIPFIGRMLPNKRQPDRSYGDFYTKLSQTSDLVQSNAAAGIDDPESIKELGKLNAFAELMGDVRATEDKDERGRREYIYQKYLVGLAREALGFEPLKSVPTPFVDPEVPDPLKKVVEHFVGKKAESGVRSLGRPRFKEGDNPDKHAVEYARWKARTEAAEEWLLENKDVPAVREAIRLEVRKGLKSRQAKTGETPDEYVERRDRRNRLWDAIQ